MSASFRDKASSDASLSQTSKAGLTFCPYSVLNLKLTPEEYIITKEMNEPLADFISGHEKLQNLGLIDYLRDIHVFYNKLKYNSFLADALFATEKVSQFGCPNVTRKTRAYFHQYPILRGSQRVCLSFALAIFGLRLFENNAISSLSFQDSAKLPAWLTHEKEASEQRALLEQIIESLFLLGNYDLSLNLANAAEIILEDLDFKSESQHFGLLKGRIYAKAFELSQISLQADSADKQANQNQEKPKQVTAKQINPQPINLAAKKQIAKIQEEKTAKKADAKKLSVQVKSGQARVINVPSSKGASKKTPPIKVQSNLNIIKPASAEVKAQPTIQVKPRTDKGKIEPQMLAPPSLSAKKEAATYTLLSLLEAMRIYFDSKERRLLLEHLNHLEDFELSIEALYTQVKNKYRVSLASVLGFAALQRDGETVKALVQFIRDSHSLDEQADLLMKTNKNKESPFFQAVKGGNLNIVKAFLGLITEFAPWQQRAILQLRNSNEQTAQSYARSQQKQDLVTLLAQVITQLNTKRDTDSQFYDI